MNERLFARLAARLVDAPVVLASVVEARGATPRKRGARMLVSAEASEGSVGGGLAEARVVAAARELLARQGRESSLDVDLGGGADAAGVCGGRMRIALRRWQGEVDFERARSIASLLARGQAAALSAADLGADAEPELAQPDDRLLVIGAGHCGLALVQLAGALDLDLWLFDTETARFANAGAPATHLSGEPARLAEALATGRRVHAVLLNRDYQADIAALRVLAQAPPRFISMMGSRRRIAEVRAALPDFDRHFAHLRAPVGLEIGAETPQEIAVSILAQVIADARSPEPANG